MQGISRQNQSIFPCSFSPAPSNDNDGCIKYYKTSFDDNTWYLQNKLLIPDNEDKYRSPRSRSPSPPPHGRQEEYDATRLTVFSFHIYHYSLLHTIQGQQFDETRKILGGCETTIAFHLSTTQWSYTEHLYSTHATLFPHIFYQEPYILDIQ